MERVVRFAIIGDVEPKPEPEFGSLHRAVDAICALHERAPLDFVAGIGDLAHKGTGIQYRGVSDALRRLPVPFHAILGNEEYGSTEARFFHYARGWNADPGAIPAVSYTRTYGGIRYVFATAREGGKEFSPAEIDWIAEQIDAANGGCGAPGGTPVVLFTHQAANGVFPDDAGKCMKGRLYSERVLSRPNLGIIFSGHSHMNLDTCTTYARDRRGVHHVHVPGIARTKIGGAHTPRFRVVQIDNGRDVTVGTCNAETGDLEPRHRIRFTLSNGAREREPATPPSG